MGTGIGKDCPICLEQMTYDKGFDSELGICDKCKELLPRFANYWFGSKEVSND